MRLTSKIWVLDENPLMATQLQKRSKSACSIRLFHCVEAFVEALQKASTKEQAKDLKDTLFVIEIALGPNEIMECIHNGKLPIASTFVVSRANTLATIREWLAAGVPDYQVKPVDTNLLWAKLERALQKKTETGEKKLRLKNLSLDAFTMTAEIDGNAKVKLTVKELQIMTRLMRSYPEGVARDQLQEEIWSGIKVVFKTLDVHLFRLRKKLAALGLEIVHLPGKNPHFKLQWPQDSG